MAKTLSKQLPPPLRRSPVVEEVHRCSDENRDSSNQAPTSLFPPRPPANRRQSLVPLFAASNVAPQLRLRTSIASSIEMSPPPKPVARRLSVFCCTPNPATPLPSATPSVEVDSAAAAADITAQLNNMRLRGGGNEPPRHPVIPRSLLLIPLNPTLIDAPAAAPSTTTTTVVNAWACERILKVVLCTQLWTVEVGEGRESPEDDFDGETTCVARSTMTEWSSSRTSKTGGLCYQHTANLFSLPVAAALLIASCLDRSSIDALVAVDTRLRDYLAPELPLTAPRRQHVRVDKLSRRHRHDKSESNQTGREALDVHVKPAASRCLTSPKAASSLPRELRDAGFELAEETRPQLGEGSFARVSLVVRKGKYFALKTVTKSPLEIRDMAEHMKREVSLHSKLSSHPSIVALYDYVEDSRRMYPSKPHYTLKASRYMLLEWCPFGSLSGILATLTGMRPLPLCITACTAALVVEQLASATKYLHENGVIHRDIKPDNILVFDLTPADIEIRLTDFGWSCHTDDPAEIYSKCGTPGFAAPEVFAGRRQYPASDIWSIGAVLRGLCGPSSDYRRFDSRLADLDQRLSRADPLARPTAEEIPQDDWIRWTLENRKNYSCAWLCQLVDHAKHCRASSEEIAPTPPDAPQVPPVRRLVSAIGIGNHAPTAGVSSPMMGSNRSPVLSPRSPAWALKSAGPQSNTPPDRQQSSNSPWRNAVAFPPGHISAPQPFTTIVRAQQQHQWQPSSQPLIYTSTVGKMSPSSDASTADDDCSTGPLSPAGIGPITSRAPISRSISSEELVGFEFDLDHHHNSHNISQHHPLADYFPRSGRCKIRPKAEPPRGVVDSFLDRLFPLPANSEVVESKVDSGPCSRLDIARTAWHVRQGRCQPIKSCIKRAEDSIKPAAAVHFADCQTVKYVTH
ncbi:hypothetical protein FOL47_000069 [Perkinsus chesapeaki]|uniref:Protein kinase domain-containing protein n=1 Tax=Perkinsus chesapeaki TaxID=330153 RepID=A0A7J6N4H1_PERCH|nr:hypothetical protein FOL47_000069 [Perkinsus chesapeaki]